MTTKVKMMSDPVLRQVCGDWSDDAGIDKAALLEEMRETMLAEGGIGLAANQIGYPVKVFILKDESPKGYEAFFNPVLLEVTEPVKFEGEGCLSIPGVTATTERFKYATLRWTDESGTEHSRKFQDMGAFAVQHEMDHLYGILYIDQFGPVKRQLIVSKHKKHVRLVRR